jgi:hypothetical protein
MGRREIIEAEQRLDRYKQRRDRYIRELAGLAPPLPEEQEAKLVARCARQVPGTHAAARRRRIQDPAAGAARQSK